MKTNTLCVHIKPVKHDLPTGSWCGPAAISAITGKPTSKIVPQIKYQRGHNGAVKGTQNYEVISALGYFGYRCLREYVYSTKRERPTLARWLRQRPKERMNDVYLVNVTGHYLVVQGRRIVDNQTGEPVFLRKYHSRRSRVVVAWRVIRKDMSYTKLPSAPKRVGSWVDTLIKG